MREAPLARVAAAAILVSDGSVGARRLHRVLSTVADLGVSRVLGFGPDLPRTLSRCAEELVVAYVSGEFESGLRLLDAVHQAGRAGIAGQEPGRARIVLVGESDTPAVASEALRRGACGYLADTLPAEQLRSALAMLAARPGGSRVIVLSPPEPAPRGGSGSGRLSRREQEVIELIARACTNAQIARRLGIAEGTVKRHVNSIFLKLQAVSRLDAVNKYRELPSAQ
jgi:DNA-binding NarL/FixJ family response regulator